MESPAAPAPATAAVKAPNPAPASPVTKGPRLAGPRPARNIRNYPRHRPGPQQTPTEALAAAPAPAAAAKPAAQPPQSPAGPFVRQPRPPRPHRGPRPRPTPQSRAGGALPLLAVKGIPSTVTAAELEGVFAAFGPVSHIRFARNSAFVKFEASAAADAVAKATAGKVLLGGVELNVKPFFKGARDAPASDPAAPTAAGAASKAAAGEPTARVPGSHSQRLVGRVVVVTGGAGALGKAIAQRLAREGARVALADLDEAGVKTVADALTSSGAEAFGMRVDVAAENSVSAWLDAVVKRWGRLDVLVNNAAAFVFGTIEGTSAADWDKVLGVNVKGYALCAKHAVRHMAHNPPLADGSKSSPALVHIASISSFVAQREFVPYNTSKGAIVQLSRCLAFDLGARGIRSNTVCPGTIETPATHKHAAHLGVSWENMVASVLKEQFVQRLGQPEDVAAAVAYLASDEAGFISGADLVVDGGYLAR